MSEYDPLEGYDDVAAGKDIELISSLYPVRIDKVQEKGVSNNGSSFARIQARITDGPFENMVVFGAIYLTAGKYGSEKLEGEFNEDGRQKFGQVQRSAEEFAQKRKIMQSNTKRILASMGLPDRNEASVPQDDEDYIFQILGVDNFEGKELMWGVDVADDGRASLNPFKTYAVDHAKNGMEAWRKRDLPKQERARQGGGSGAPVRASVGSI